MKKNANDFLSITTPYTSIRPVVSVFHSTFGYF